jgi:hypothetical protein
VSFDAIVNSCCFAHSQTTQSSASLIVSRRQIPSIACCGIFFGRKRSEAKRPHGKRTEGARSGRGYKWNVPRELARQGRKPVYAADGTLALGGRPWVRSKSDSVGSRQFLAEWILLNPLWFRRAEAIAVGRRRSRCPGRRASLFSCFRVSVDANTLSK